MCVVVVVVVVLVAVAVFTLTRIIKSVVTGQAPVTLDMKALGADTKSARAAFFREYRVDLRTVSRTGTAVMHLWSFVRLCAYAATSPSPTISYL